MYVYLEGRGNKGRERDLKGEGDEEEEELGFGEEKTTAEEEMQECAMYGPLDSGERERGREEEGSYPMMRLLSEKLLRTRRY